MLKVMDAIGDDTAELVTGFIRGELEGGVGVAPVVESLAVVAEFIHDSGDAFALAQGFEGELLVMGERAFWVWKGNGVRVLDIRGKEGSAGHS